MKQLFTFLSFILIVVTAFAAPIDSVTTQRVATAFYSSKAPNGPSYRNIDAELVYCCRSGNNVRGGSAIECFRIYNIGGGFVIVSADDRIQPILGYSTEGRFPNADIPEPIEELLTTYREAITSVISNDAPEQLAIQNQWRMLIDNHQRTYRSGTPVIAPLLSTTWNQNEYYNNACPTDVRGPGGHVYAGCVATAMAQIIRYWQYPTHGIGNHSYNADYAYQGYGNYGLQQVDFGNATYNYANMPTSLTSSTPSAQINEVAKLIYHCGVSVNMEYGYSGSGAVSSYAASAFNNYFGYSGCYHKNRSSYSEANWITLLKTNLDNAQPILYHGSGSGSHAFVCDGYDSQNYFHFNFGWSGLYNGYYLLTSLSPSPYNFSGSQGAVFGISANLPIIRPSINHLVFFIEANTVSEGREVSIITNALTADITATAHGNFYISTDSVNYYTTRTISSAGSKLYIQYQPVDNVNNDEGFVTLSSGVTRDTIFLTGKTYNRICLPPQNLTVSSQNLQLISLNWEAPAIDPEPETISWSSDVQSFMGGFSTNAVTILHRYTDTDLMSYNGKALTDIEFYASENITGCSAVVYKGGSLSGTNVNPGALVCEQVVDINTINLGDWNTITLNSPVIIDATQELWFGVKLTAPSGSYFLPVNFTPVPNKGCIFAENNNGNTIWSTYDAFCFVLKGTVKWTQVVNNYSIYRNDIPLGATAGTSKQDFVNTTGTYLYTVIANWSNG